MTTKLPPFPVHDEVLDLIEESLSGAYIIEDGEHIWTGSEFNFHTLLDFYSGYDPALSVPAQNEYDTELPGVYKYQGPLYNERNVILALIAEIRRLRGQT